MGKGPCSSKNVTVKLQKGFYQTLSDFMVEPDVNVSHYGFKIEKIHDYFDEETEPYFNLTYYGEDYISEDTMFDAFLLVHDRLLMTVDYGIHKQVFTFIELDLETGEITIKAKTSL